MFTVKNFIENNKNFLKLENLKENSVAKISLDEGGSLQKLKIDNKVLIEKQANFEYENSFASAILFPFANRIKDGKYTFEDKKYQLESNETESTNALHGLVYNKKFELVKQEITKNSCAVTICYSEKENSIGFPYKYDVILTYTLSKENLELKIAVKNTDLKKFPFTLGWHPYFFSSDLKNSSLVFKSDKKVIFDENLITKHLQNSTIEVPLKIEKNQLDDSFVLKDPKIGFTTPDYQMELTTDYKDNYLQLYTPAGFPLIAIEPMTGISDSFNNNIGLQVLEPSKTHSVTWNLKILSKSI